MPDVLNGITVTGEGTTEAPPDTVRIVLGVSVNSESASEAHGQAAKQMDSVIRRLKGLGIPPSHIRTFSYSMWQEPEHSRFIVTNHVEARTDDVSMSGKLIDAAISAGANNVQSIHMDIRDRSDLERQARELAMQDAKAKATQLAKLGKLKLDKPIRIVEGDGDGPVMARTARAVALNSTATPVESGQLQVSVRLAVTYATK